MRLQFLGTRGYIDARTKAHWMHASALIESDGNRVMIDCGEDWREKVTSIAPDAIAITHAHPDHAWGLKGGVPYPVYATRESWDVMRNFQIENGQMLEPRVPTTISGIQFEAFPVVHSTRAPAVGYRITVGKKAIFYIPDVVYIQDRAAALAGVLLYIGDGATVTRSMVRKPSDVLIGHTPIRTQLTWCQKEGVPRAIFTHCGTEVVEGGTEIIDRVRELAQERGVQAQIAFDGMQIDLDQPDPIAEGLGRKGEEE